MRPLLLYIVIGISLMSCTRRGEGNKTEKTGTGVSLLVLGTVQDGGSPHAGCKDNCCRNLFENPDPKRKVTSLGVIDRKTGSNWLFEAGPDLRIQMKLLKRISGKKDNETPAGIFLTHAHIGHYTGLMFLGKESVNSKNVKVFAMPRMKQFLENNGPWNQLLALNNISIEGLREDSAVEATPQLKVIPFSVPHRDEYSETVGYRIEGPSKKVIFIPDIDKWQKWNRNIVAEILKVDYAFIDGTFFNAREVKDRDISEIPHPFVSESMSLFENLPITEKKKIYFTHLNHSNPLLDQKSLEHSEVLKAGFNIAAFGQVIDL